MRYQTTDTTMPKLTLEGQQLRNEIVALLEHVLSDHIDPQDVDRSIGRALSAAHTICRLLERVGAPTIPPTH